MKRIKVAYRGYELNLDTINRSYILNTNNVIDVEIICVSGTIQVEGMTLLSGANNPEASKVFRSNTHFNEKIGQNLNIRIVGQAAKIFIREKFIVA